MRNPAENPLHRAIGLLIIIAMALVACGGGGSQETPTPRPYNTHVPGATPTTSSILAH